MADERTFQLVLGTHSAVVAAHGGRVVAYRVGATDLLCGEENPAFFAFRGSLLAPWPNRVVGGRWTWQGGELQLPVNDPATGSALHGLVYDVDWTVVRIQPWSIKLSYALPPHAGYPFPLQLTVSYALSTAGLACALTAVNTGDQPAPVGLGVHPYIPAPARVDELVVTIPAARALQTDAIWQETGRVPVADAGLDFRTPRLLGDLEVDRAFTDVAADPSGRTEASVRWPDGREVAVWSEASCRWWLLYTGHTLPPPDFRRSLGVEPMTCPPNALNTGEIDVLAPGEQLRLDWGFSLR